MNKREAILLVDNYLEPENGFNVMTLFDNKPFIEYLLDFYNLFGFDHFVLMVNDKKNTVVSYLGNKYKDSKLVWMPSEVSKGQCCAIRNGLEAINSDNVLVASASILFRANIGKFFKDHCDKRVPLSTLVSSKSEMNNNDTIVEVDIAGHIKNIAQKAYNSKKHLFFSGIYMINKLFMQSEIFSNSISIEEDIIKTFYKTEQFQVMVSDNYYLNINNLKSTNQTINLNKFDIEYIISDIEKNQSQLELVS